MKKNVLGLLKYFVYKCLKKNQLRYFLMLGFGAILVFSCEKKALGSLETRLPKVQDKLSLCISSDVSSLDPRYGLDGTSTQVIKMLFEGLVYIDSSGKVAPAIAASYEISSDKKTYVFHLKDCQWSNGMDITAYDFEYTWKSILKGKQDQRSAAIHNFRVIKNVSAYLYGDVGLHEVGVQSLDAKTLKVELENPIPYFLEAISNTCFFPVCKLIDKTNPQWAREKEKKFVCNGAFHLLYHHYDNEVLLEKNPLFWDSKHVSLHKISVLVVEDAMTRLCLFEKGKIDWIGKPLSGLPLDACAILKKEDKITTFPSLAIYWYFFNTERFPFTNKKMRKAFAYAINRKEITDYVLQFNEIPATELLSKAYGLVEEEHFQDNDSEKAKVLLEEALLELGLKKENLPELSISYNSDEIHSNVAQIIQHQIFTVLGVKVKLKHVDWKTHYSNLVQGDYCIGGMMWQSWVRDPIYILQTFRSKNDGINMSRWENRLYQDVLDASEKEMNLTKRKELLALAQRIILEEMPVIPVYFNSITFSKHKELKDVSLVESSQIDFRHAYFEESLK